MEKCLEFEIARAFGWVMDVEIGTELVFGQGNDIGKFELRLIFGGNLACRTQSFQTESECALFSEAGITH